MCQTNDIVAVENGRKDSDIRPKKMSGLPTKMKGLYMDQAISKTNFGLFNYIQIFVSGMVLNAVLMETLGVAFIMPVSDCDLRLTASEKGILSAISFVGIICGSHLWGFLADTKGRRRIIMPTLFVAFLSSIVASFVDNFYIFVSLRFINGFFMYGSAATIYAYLSEFHDTKQRSRAIMGSAIIYGLSCVLLPLVAWIVINQDWQFNVPYIDVEYKPWRLFLVVCSLPGLFSVIMLMFLPESPKFVLGQGDKVKAYEILRMMNRINNGKNAEFEEFHIYEEPESIANRQRILKCKESRFPLLESVWIQTAPLFKPPLLSSTVLICTIQFGIYATSNGLYMFVAEILNKMASNLDSFVDQRMPMCEVLNMNPTNLTVIELDNTSEEECVTKLEISTVEQGIILETFYAVGFIVIGFLINKTGKFPILFTLLIGSGSSGFVCMLTDIPLVQICAFIALLCCGMAVNIVNAATVDLYPTSSRAMAVCISLMFGRLGCVVGANAAALLLENHCEMVFYLSGSTVILIGIMTFCIPNIHDKGKESDVPMPTGSRLSVVSLH